MNSRELFEQLTEYSDTPSIKYNFKHTCNNLTKTFNNYLFTPQNKNRNSSKLLEYIADGKEENAINSIEKNPDLLFIAGSCKDLTRNKYIDYTPYGLATYLHDTNILEAMDKYITKINNGAEKASHILQRAIEQHKSFNYYNFETIMDAFESNNTDLTNNAIKNFKNHFSPKNIKDDYIFNIKNLLF
ncbi:hypothetical protein N9L02_03460, partial [Gammaproteobacteria bacterium]|nr:hypothetical protein [Gammaproteobacteria bacterium]